MKAAQRLGTAAIALVFLAACGNETGARNPVASAFGQMAKASLSKGKGGKTAASPAATRVGREELSSYGKPILRVRSKGLGQDSFLTIADTKAEVITWTAAAQATFSLRDGVLIQTRGLGADLMSAAAPSLAQLKTAASYQRIYYFLGGDDRGTRRTYDCVASIVGDETVEVLGKNHTVTHVAETCTRPNGKVSNDFWIEGATIRKSRQWASGGVGYLEFEQVID